MPCTICLFSKRWWHDIRQLKCKHKFHLDCITNWTNNNRTCPICRIEILRQRDINIYELWLCAKNRHPKNLTSTQVLVAAGIE